MPVGYEHPSMMSTDLSEAEQRLRLDRLIDNVYSFQRHRDVGLWQLASLPRSCISIFTREGEHCPPDFLLLLSRDSNASKVGQHTQMCMWRFIPAFIGLRCLTQEHRYRNLSNPDPRVLQMFASSPRPPTSGIFSNPPRVSIMSSCSPCSSWVQ